MSEEAATVPVEKVREKEFKLGDGRTVKIVKGQGRHAKLAQRHIDRANPEETYKWALMASVTFIDGKPVTAEDLEKLDLDEFHLVQATFAEINL